MMTDIVERLKSSHPNLTGDLYTLEIIQERALAAAEIERLRARLAECEGRSGDPARHPEVERAAT